MSELTTSSSDDLEDNVDNDLLSWLLYSGDSLDFDLNSSPVSNGATDCKSEGDTDERTVYEEPLGDGSHISSKSNNRKKRHRDDALEKRLEELQTGKEQENTYAILIPVREHRAEGAPQERDAEDR